MAFVYRTNTEVLYYRNAVNFLREAISSYGYVAYHINYGSDNEHVNQECLPITRHGINFSILAIINFACCAEACYNLAINEYCRKRHMDNFEGEHLDYLLTLGVPSKIQVINKMYNKIIPRRLKRKLESLALVRNGLVHYSEPIRFCGGSIYDNGYMSLKISQLFSVYKSVAELVKILLEKNILSQDIRTDEALIFGDGDITFDEKVSLFVKIRFVVKHPIRYLVRRLPQKIRDMRNRKKIYDNLCREFQQITDKYRCVYTVLLLIIIIRHFCP